jgi:hypothetical protein
MPLGTCIVRIVGITLGDIMDLSKYDRTQLTDKWRQQCWRNGNRIKTRRWLDRNGAERDTSENKIIRSVYKKTMWNYWDTLDPRLRERAERMSIYANYPVPRRALAISLKKQGARHSGVLDTGATSTNATERSGSVGRGK